MDCLKSGSPEIRLKGRDRHAGGFLGRWCSLRGVEQSGLGQRGKRTRSAVAGKLSAGAIRSSGAVGPSELPHIKTRVSSLFTLH